MVLGPEQMRGELGAAMAGARTPLGAANRLCESCVDILEVDGASISITYEGSSRGTFGSSGELSRMLDEFQFTFGEGPCLDAVAKGRPVLVADLADPQEVRWPAFRSAVIDSGVNAVFAIPVTLSSYLVGALDLYNLRSGPLSAQALAGGLLAADLAALPLLDLMSNAVQLDEHAESEYGWEQLQSLERVEVYQATGMIIGALQVSPPEAMVLLRGRAYALGMTASDLAWAIVERRIALLEDEGWGPPARPGDGAP